MTQIERLRVMAGGAWIALLLASLAARTLLIEHSTSPMAIVLNPFLS